MLINVSVTYQEYIQHPDAWNSRSKDDGYIPEMGKSTITQTAFINDGIKAWNKAPQALNSANNFTLQKLK